MKKIPIVLIVWWIRSKLRFMIHDYYFFLLVSGTVLRMCHQLHTQKKCNEKPSLRFPLYIFHSNCKSNRLISEKNHNQHILCTPASILISSKYIAFELMYYKSILEIYSQNYALWLVIRKASDLPAQSLRNDDKNNLNSNSSLA